MTNLNLLEQRFIECENCQADDNYITDGIVLVNKDFIRNKIIKNFKSTSDNIMKTIPYDKGEEIILTDVDTRCRLCPNNIIGIDVGENECVNYAIVREFVKSLVWDFPYFTIQPYLTGHLIKVFAGDNKFCGCFASMKGNK